MSLLDRVTSFEDARNESRSREGIPTVYDGRGLGSTAQLFRSQVEAETAWWLDVHHIPWTYEAIGKDYHPDFNTPGKLMIECGVREQKFGNDEKLTRAVPLAASAGWLILVWDSGRDAWTMVKMSPTIGVRAVGGRTFAYRCARCGNWGWQLTCWKCGDDAGFDAEHGGRSAARVAGPGGTRTWKKCPAGVRQRELDRAFGGRRDDAKTQELLSAVDLPLAGGYERHEGEPAWDIYERSVEKPIEPQLLVARDVGECLA